MLLVVGLIVLLLLDIDSELEIEPIVAPPVDIESCGSVDPLFDIEEAL